VDGRGSRSLREFLDRFRRPAGVPAQVADELLAELEPLFAGLDALDREAARLRDEAARRIALDREAATREVAELLAAGRERAERTRTQVADAARGAAGVEAEAVRSAALREADRIRAQARTRMEPLVALVVRCVQDGPP
jgi:hypothetical protein